MIILFVGCQIVWLMFIKRSWCIHLWSTIGWEPFLRGHFSRQWGKAYKAQLPPKSKNVKAQMRWWSKLLILSLWAYSREIWAARNAVVHGKSRKGAVKLMVRVEKYRKQYDVDPYFIPGSRNYLFSWTKDYTLPLHQDALRFWVKSVEEAHDTQLHRSKLLAETQAASLKIFLIQKTNQSKSNSSSCLKDAGDIFAPPFSARYYKQIAMTHININLRERKEDQTNQWNRGRARGRIKHRHSGIPCLILASRYIMVNWKADLQDCS